jgi:hypothetical protein
VFQQARCLLHDSRSFRARAEWFQVYRNHTVTRTDDFAPGSAVLGMRSRFDLGMPAARATHTLRFLETEARFVATIQGGDTVAELDILGPEFAREAEAAWDRARNQALARGVPVFYRNDRTGLEIMEQPDGRRFEIRFIPGAPRGRNFETIRELARNAA